MATESGQEPTSPAISPFTERESQEADVTSPMRRIKIQCGDSFLYGFSTIEEGLNLFRQRGLVLLCWVVLITMPVLILRDFFFSVETTETLESQLIMGIRIALWSSGIMIILSTRLFTKRTLGTYWMQHIFFTLCVVMVALTVVEKGGANSPIYAGFLTVLVGWGYFFSMPAFSMALLSCTVIIGYVCVLAWRTEPSISQWEQVFINCSYLMIGAACAAYAATINLRSQVKRFETILTEHHLASLDPLTSVMNRKALSNRIQSAEEEHKRYRQEMACLLIEVDGLKNINKTWGQETGDQVLIHVSDLITKLIGSQGEIGRWQKNEFMVVLSATNRRKALIHAERLRAAIERSKFTNGGDELGLTVTIGVGTADANEGDDHHLCAEYLAVQALRNAKKQGRNRVGASTRHTEEPLPARPQERRFHRLPPMPELTPEEYDRWIRRLGRRGYTRMCFMLSIVLVSTGLLESLTIIPEHNHLIQTATSIRVLVVVALLGALWLVRSSMRFYLNIIALQYMMLVLAGFAFCALTITTQSQDGPGFILMMFVLLIGSVTTPGGMKYGAPVFLSLCLMWPLMVMATGDFNSTDLVVRSSIILIMGITCTLSHHHFHVTSRQQVKIKNHLNSLSLSDGVTGAWNKRGFDARLIHLCDTSNRSKGLLSLIVLDISDQEKIKSIHGPDASRSALRHFADTIHRHIRTPDVLARLDKNKFAIILPQTPSSGAIKLITRIKEALGSNPYITEDAGALRLEASVGISEHKGCPINPKVAARALLDHAEAALSAARERRSKRSYQTHVTVPTLRAHSTTRLLPTGFTENTQP